jgi:hypothetical protein
MMQPRHQQTAECRWSTNTAAQMARIAVQASMPPLMLLHCCLTGSCIAARASCCRSDVANQCPAAVLLLWLTCCRQDHLCGAAPVQAVDGRHLQMARDARQARLSLLMLLPCCLVGSWVAACATCGLHVANCCPAAAVLRFMCCRQDHLCCAAPV